MPHHGEPPAGVGGVVHYKRIVNCLFNALTGSGVGVINGAAHLAPIQFEFPMTLDRLASHIRAAAGLNNARYALYADNGDLPDNGALIVQTPSTPTVGRGKHEAVIPNTPLLGRLCWIAAQSDGVDFFLQIQQDEAQLGTLTCRRFNQAYGPFPDPCPVTVLDGYQTPWMYARVASVP